VVAASSNEKGGVNGGNVAARKAIGKLVGSGPRKKGSRPWCSIAADICITGGEGAGGRGACGRARVLAAKLFWQQIGNMSSTASKENRHGSLNLKEQVVFDQPLTKVVKGGKNLSFSALVWWWAIRGEDRGFRYRQGQGSAGRDQEGYRGRPRRICARIHVLATHLSSIRCGHLRQRQVLLKPAPAGTGVIAGGPVRA